MPRYKIIFTHKALSDLDDASDDDFERIHKACKRLENSPFPDGKHIYVCKMINKDSNI